VWGGGEANRGRGRGNKTKIYSALQNNRIGWPSALVFRVGRKGKVEKKVKKREPVNVKSWG